MAMKRKMKNGEPRTENEPFHSPFSVAHSPFFIFLLVALLIASLPAFAQQADSPVFRIVQEPVETYTRDEAGKQVRYVNVKFTVTREGRTTSDVGKQYKILIEENNHRVKVEDVPAPKASQAPPCCARPTRGPPMSSLGSRSSGGTPAPQGTASQCATSTT